MSLRSSYTYLYKTKPLKLDPPELTRIEGRGCGHDAGTRTSPACEKCDAKSRPESTEGRESPQQAHSLGEAGATSSTRPPSKGARTGQPSLRPGSGAGARKAHEHSVTVTFREGRLSIFHVTMFQTLILISIGVQLQDLAFEIPIWQD